MSDSIESEIVERYRARTPRSAACFARASRALAGGVTGSLRYFPPHPLYMASGEGARCTDVDGNEYVDCFLCNGPLLLGHRPASVLASIREYEAVGSLVVNPTLAIELAERVQQAVPCAERVRFVNSGSEAVLAALRCARAYTGKSRVVKFRGHYHGQDDQVLVGLGANSLAAGAGIPPSALAATLTLPYGDLAAVEATLRADDDVAAVILDPAMSNGGLFGSAPEFLGALRALTRERGVLLIFDEVITGFRLALGGAQQFYGVRPDLVTLAKALAAGERLGAIAGSESVLRCLDPTSAPSGRFAFQSGTGNDGTVSLAAALGALDAYRRLDAEGAYAELFARSERLAHGIEAAFASHRLPCRVQQLGPMLQLFLTDAPPSFERFSVLDTRPLQLFYLALLDEGALLSLPTSNHVYLSFAHTDAEVDLLLAATHAVLERYEFATLVRAA